MTTKHLYCYLKTSRDSMLAGQVMPQVVLGAPAAPTAPDKVAPARQAGVLTHTARIASCAGQAQACTGRQHNTTQHDKTARPRCHRAGSTAAWCLCKTDTCTWGLAEGLRHSTSPGGAAAQLRRAEGAASSPTNASALSVQAPCHGRGSGTIRVPQAMPKSQQQAEPAEGQQRSQRHKLC